MQPDIIFNAQILKGFVPKLIFDAMATNIHRIPIVLTQDEIIICAADKEDSPREAHSLWNTRWSYKKLGNYVCTTPGTICVDIKRLRTMLKGVKKKESVTFYIKKDNPDLLYVTIQSVGSGEDGALPQSETMTSPIVWKSDYVMPSLPDKYKGEDGIICDAYDRPMIIGATDFQKIKKMTNACKGSISVKLQKNNYASFFVGDPSMLTGHLEFGRLSDDSSIYEKAFAKNLLAPLVKLPGLCTHMEFYAPLIDTYPLKVTVSVTTGLCCDVTVYIKDNDQINQTATKQLRQPSPQQSPSPKSIRATRKDPTKSAK